MRSTPFKSDEEFLEDIQGSLNGFDLIDLLEKLSCLRFFLQTNFMECKEEERSFLWNIFSGGFSFLFPFLICYRVKAGKTKISYDELYAICKKVALYLFADEFRKDELDSRNDKISYVQNNLTDLIGGIKKVPVECLLSCQDGLIKKKYGITAQTISEELLGVFERKIYCPHTQLPSIPIDEFVNNFNTYIDTESFIVAKGAKSYSLCDALSIGFGAFGADKFSIENPLSVVNLKRKLFIKDNGRLYNLCEDLICGRLNRSVESLFKEGAQSDEWRQNYKERTEGLPKQIFGQFLPGGTYYGNVYYLDEAGKRCESDGLYLFHDFVFVIEVKGDKFNPDPIQTKQKSVGDSYKNVTSKAESQSSRTKRAILKNKEFHILNSRMDAIGKIEETNLKKVISICIYYEDIGTFLAGQSFDVEDVLHITFYDLLLVFHFIENPFLIAKYLMERSCALSEKRFDFNDEMTFLSLFRTCIHLNECLNSQSIPADKNIGEIVFPNNEFGLEIELYFMGGGVPKPEIEINGFMKRLINLEDYSAVDDNVFTGVFALLNKSAQEWKDLEQKYKSRNFLGRRIPLNIYFDDRVHRPFIFTIISKTQNSEQGEQNLFFISGCFENRKNVEYVYLYEIGEDDSSVKRFRKPTALSVDSNSR